MVSKISSTLGPLTICYDHANCIEDGLRNSRRKKRIREGTSRCVRCLGKTITNLPHFMFKGLLGEAPREQSNVSSFSVGRTVTHIHVPFLVLPGEDLLKNHLIRTCYWTPTYCPLDMLSLGALHMLITLYLFHNKRLGGRKTFTFQMRRWRPRENK